MMIALIVISALAVMCLCFWFWQRGRRIITIDYPASNTSDFYRDRLPALQAERYGSRIDERYDVHRFAFIYAESAAAADSAFETMISFVRAGREDWPPYEFKRRHVRKYIDCRYENWLAEALTV
jgi:hypothetical protein